MYHRHLISSSNSLSLVEQLSLRMDTGGWVLAADFASKLGITTDELIIRARHYPSECIEFSVWKDSSNPDVAHLHAIRASFGHIYPWIRVDRLGVPVSMTEIDELNDIRVFVRPVFMETIVLDGIVTRQLQGHDRMSTDFCTRIVISTARVNHMDRLRLGAELADYVLFLDKFRVMLDGVIIYRVNDETFVATGPIPPSCIRGIFVAESGGFKSIYVSTLTSKSPLEGGDVPTRGRAVGAKSAGGGYAPAISPTVGTASGGNAPARVPTPSSGSYAPARGSRPLTLVQGHYFSKCIPCGLSWGSHDLPEARCSHLLLCILWERRGALIPLVGAMSLHAVKVFLRFLLRRWRRVA